MTLAVLGLILLASTALYAFPRTAVLGAILLTGYLGGAVASHARHGDPLLAHDLFGVYLGLFVSGSLWFRDARIRSLMPFRISCCTSSTNIGRKGCCRYVGTADEVSWRAACLLCARRRAVKLGHYPPRNDRPFGIFHACNCRKVPPGASVSWHASEIGDAAASEEHEDPADERHCGEGPGAVERGAVLSALPKRR